MSPSSNWIAAASRTDRKPILCLAIESVDAISASIFDEAGWQAGTLTNLNASNTAADQGVLVLQTNGIEQVANTFHTLPYAPVDPPGWIYGQTNKLSITATETWPNGVGNGLVIVYTIGNTSIGPYGGTATGGNLGANNRTNGATFGFHFQSAGPDCIISGSVDGGITWVDLYTITNPAVGPWWTDQTYSITTPSIGPWQFKMRFEATIGSFSITLNWYQTTYYTAYLPSGSTRTGSVDLGLVPTANSIVDISSDESSIATLTFEAFGSNDNAAWADLGTVFDGSSISPYRYYQFAVAFTSSNGQETPVLRSIGVSGGDNQYTYYSTHPDVPVMGAMPYLQADIGTLSSAIQLMKIGTTGQASPKLFYLDDTFNLIQTGFLRNKTVQVLMGFVGLSKGDYEPIFTGLWYDGAIDLTKGLINVTTRTVFSLFQKVQIPSEKALNGVRDAETCPPWFRIGAPIMQTMLDVLDLLGVPGRYIDSASFNTLAASHFSGSNWLVSRLVDKDSKEDAVKLLEELSALAGVFILPQPNGVISAVLYDPTVTPTIELSPDNATFDPVQLGQSELFTRQQILYNPKHKNDLTDGVSWGTWANGGVYGMAQVIIDPLTWLVYHCWAAHVASDDTEPGYGPGWRSYWFIRWAPNTTYSATAPALLTDLERIVVHNKTVYTCTANVGATLVMEPGVTSGWASYWRVGATIDGVPNPWDTSSVHSPTLLLPYETLSVQFSDPWLWQTNFDYSKSDSIYRVTGTTPILYRCILNHTSGPELAGSNPSEPAIGGNRRICWATEWLPGVTYQPSDVAIARLCPV